ncbi:hypothetical protein HOJ75_00195 [Candidatus Woesearchaeota archaeon]|nr:hypothetical protein [Candidatus Woesearchaeota archaeon]
MVVQLHEAIRHAHIMFLHGLPKIDFTDKDVLERVLVVWDAHENLPRGVREFLNRNGDDELREVCKYAREEDVCNHFYDCIVRYDQWDKILHHDVGEEYGNNNEAEIDARDPEIIKFLTGETNEFKGKVYTFKK